ncbi:hypothetical protein [Trinickia acidisoli]|uniref:hypothetical protein n=1 Tax=Trinickia acidisoli TaxID=2767482 RepID=UPI001A8E5AF7|nr:hypothetical protein [Trinickia acidisoli]
MTPFANEHQPEDGDMHNTISHEMEDRVRHLRESGYPAHMRDVFAARWGSGEHSQIMQCIFGLNKDEFALGVEREYPRWESSPYLFSKPYDYERDGPGRYLTASQCVDLYSAVAFANSIGLLMDVHVSITWGLLGIEDHSEAAKALRYEFFKHLHDWYRHKVPGGRPFVWLYVHEDGRTHGFHTHILTAIPNELRPAFRKWVEARLTAISRADGLHKDAFEIRAAPSDPIYRQWCWLQYLLKSVSATAEVSSVVGTSPFARVAQLILSRRGRPGNVRCKKKCGVSNAIGKQSRRKAGFRSLMERGVADVRRLYAGLEYLGYLRRHGEDISSDNARRLIEAERQVNEIEEQERENARRNAKARRAARAVRRVQAEEEKLSQVRSERFQKEQTELTQRALMLFRL